MGSALDSRLQKHEIWYSVQLEASDLEPYLTNVHDKALKHSLQYGVGFLHETMSAGEQEIVNRLFNNGAIQVDSQCSATSNALLLAVSLSYSPTSTWGDLLTYRSTLGRKSSDLHLDCRCMLECHISAQP